MRGAGLCCGEFPQPTRVRGVTDGLTRRCGLGAAPAAAGRRGAGASASRTEDARGAGRGHAPSVGAALACGWWGVATSGASAPAA